MNIFIVSNNEATVSDFLNTLQESRITHHTRAEEALRDLAGKPEGTDLLAIDTPLPDMSGPEIVRALHRRKICLPKVILVSPGEEHIAAEAVSSGFDYYLIKDPRRGYLMLLPAVLPEVVRRHRTLLANSDMGRALEDAEKRYRTLFELSAEGILVADSESGQIYYANPSVSKILGYSPEELKTMHISEIRPRHNPPCGMCGLGGSENEKKNLWSDLPFLRKDGRTIYADFSVTTIPISGRKCRVGFMRDTTERKLMRENLRQVLAQQNAILKNVAVGIAYLRMERIIWTNQRMNELFGYTRKELAHLRIVSCFPSHADYERFREEALQVFAKGEAVRTEYHMKHRDGHLFWCNMVGKAITPEDLDQGSIWILQDITSRIRAREELMRAKEAAEAAAKAKSDFCAFMTHEIRTPLNAILGMTQLLGNGNLTPQQSEFVRSIQFSGDSLMTVINDVLDFSKIESGKLKLEEDVSDLRKCIEEICGLMEVRASAKCIRLTYDIAPDVPNPIVTDATRLRQILLNLVGNAIKFTDNGAVRISISRVSGDRKTCTLQFSVEDTGIGISPDTMTCLFEPFCQADTSISRRYGGTGLGLTISSRLVELMSGKIWCKSNTDKGSTFFFTIQAGFAAPGASCAATRHGTDPDTFARIGCDHPLRILAAEDTPTNQKVLFHMLRKMGYEADMVLDGKEALAALRQKTYDVVLMDIRMPEMDGVQATQIIRREWPRDRQPRLIAMTADALSEEREEYLRNGMDDYISKPIQMERLAEALKACRPLGTRTPQEPADENASEDTSEAGNLMETDGRIDLTQVCSLAGGAREVITDWIITFLEDVPVMIDKMEKAASENDLRALRLAAHSVKSQSSIFGAAALAELSRDLECSEDGCPKERLSEKIGILKAEYEQVETALKKKLA